MGLKEYGFLDLDYVDAGAGRRGDQVVIAMTLSGPEALKSLDDALRDIRREEDEIAKRLARSAELVDQVPRDRERTVPAAGGRAARPGDADRNSASG